MKQLAKRVKYVLEGEEGASNVEIIIWMSVCLVIGTVLFLFKDSVVAFVNKVIGVINGLQVG